MFLKCSDNNRSSTVSSEFTAAVDFHGLLRQIRTDKVVKILKYGNTWLSSTITEEP